MNGPCPGSNCGEKARKHIRTQINECINGVSLSLFLSIYKYKYKSRYMYLQVDYECVSVSAFLEYKDGRCGVEAGSGWKMERNLNDKNWEKYKIRSSHNSGEKIKTVRYKDKKKKNRRNTHTHVVLLCNAGDLWKVNDDRQEIHIWKFLFCTGIR